MVNEKQTLTEKNNVGVYQETTKLKKPKNRDKSDLGPDFVAPDGGWAWVVCLAAGLGNLSIFPALQQYGFIYRQRMENLGFDAKETTTIVNILMAVSSLVGIANGAMFRRFTFRQVALTGSLLVFIGIFASAFCTTFTQYVICFSTIYGIGVGFCTASNALAVNTYFKKLRRRATGFTWTITGLGPIVFPYLSTIFLVYYGTQGSILIYAAISLNSVLCAMTLQPVMWHVREPGVNSHELEAGTEPLNATETTANEENLLDYECRYCEQQRLNKRGLFSSQYLYNDNDPETSGYEITEPATPMLARANDGWFGSKMSLSSELNARYRHKVMRQCSQRSVETGLTADFYKPKYLNRERYASKESVYTKPAIEEFRCTCAEEKALMQKDLDKELKLEKERLLAELVAVEAAQSKMSFKQKVVKFFDLDLLKDITFVNLSLGITIMMFGEMNFSVLTPFILHSYGYTDAQISLAMSLLAGVDILVRFLAPIALERVKLDNRVLYAFGIIATSMGRFLLTITSSYNMLLAIFLLIGFGKGFRTIFATLILPSYVPLKRLPAASGLQLIFNTLFSTLFGPILGMITMSTSYTGTIHFINALSCLALLMWLLESLVRKLLGKKAMPMDE